MRRPSEVRSQLGGRGDKSRGGPNEGKRKGLGDHWSKGSLHQVADPRYWVADQRHRVADPRLLCIYMRNSPQG